MKITSPIPAFLRAFTFFTALAVACSLPDKPLPTSFSGEDAGHRGMHRILAAGKSFTQGWNNSLASQDERPGMQSAFSYDYWIDTTEVTQKRFFDVTGRNPVSAASQYGTGDNYPVYSVTWFDAVLFCNSRSKAESLDTVYIYSKIRSQPNGSVNELLGFRCDLSRDGYRLPTEAEWEFAARGASSALSFTTASDSVNAQSVAWFAANSNGTTHPVAGKMPNSLGLYDMAGNVFEWTTDWKCFYNGASITNSLGAYQPNSENEKVIKGGSFEHGLIFLRPSHRSATYGTVLSSACEYVGFRCARGAFPNGRYIGMAPANFTSNPVSVAVGANALYAFTGAFASKVVFVNVSGQYRTLCCVDFSRAFPQVMEFSDDKAVYMPVISPDGRFAAWCSNNTGQGGPSKISIRSLDSITSPVITLFPDTAYMPHWWINRSTGDMGIVYTTSAILDNDPSWKSTKTFLQKMSAGQPVGSPQVLINDGSYHDGLSADGQYAVTSYPVLMMRNLSTNEERQLFQPPHNGKDASGSTQACNASMSPDTSPGARCMFLDFGCTTPSAITNCSYRLHQYLFVATFFDSIVNYLRCPQAEDAWDFPKWSNRERFAVSAARNSQDEAHAVYVIDLNNHTSQEVLTGVELEQPYLWLGNILSNPAGLDLDSLGLYEDPLLFGNLPFFTDRMHFFWQFLDSLGIVFLGTSHTAYAVDPKAFTNNRVFNMSICNSDLPCAFTMIFDYLLNHCPQLKLIGMDLILGRLQVKNGEVNFSQGILINKGYNYDKNHFFWKQGLPDNFIAAVTSANSPLPDFDTLGICRSQCYGWSGANPPIYIPLDWDTSALEYKENMHEIDSLIDSLSARRIHLLIFIGPENPAYYSLNACGAFGPNLATGHAVIAAFKARELQNPYFHFYDGNIFGQHDYPSEDFFDDSHLCYAGAQKFSMRMDSLIQGILSK
jgi:uncharacterized protein (TIGR02171 family)